MIGGIERVRTPALVIDAPTVDHNIVTALEVMGGPDRWRPHVKTSRLRWTMARLRDHGLQRFKCATTLELDVLGSLAAPDVLVAYPLVGPAVRRVGELAADPGGAAQVRNRGGKLARSFGVRMPIQAGRGYSFSFPIEQLPAGPIYFPAERLGCTPLGDRLRVAGMMEFRLPEEPLDRRRIAAITDAIRPLLRDAHLDDRRDEWVGSRPCTPDGLPLIGPTASPRVFIAGVTVYGASRLAR